MKKVISIIIMSLFLCQGCVQEKQDMVSKISLQEKSMAKIITTEVAFNKTKEQYLGNVVYDDIFSVFYLKSKENKNICLGVKKFVSQKTWEEYEIDLSSDLIKYIKDTSCQFYLTNYMCDTEDVIYACLRISYKAKNSMEVQNEDIYGIVEINLRNSSTKVLWKKKAGEDEDLSHIASVYLLDNGNFMFYNYTNQSLLEYSRLGESIQTYALENFEGNFIGIANDEIWTYDETESIFMSYTIEEGVQKHRVLLDTSIKNETEHVPIIYYNDKNVYYVMFGKQLLRIKNKKVEIVSTTMELPAKFIAPYAKEIYNTIYFPEYKQSDLSEFFIYSVNVSEDENKVN